jgi:dTDP-glucose pyrophosphorylase
VGVASEVLVSAGSALRLALEAITRNSRQAAVVVDAAGRLQGLVTDGDVRRALLRGTSLDEPVEVAMNRAPVTVPEGTPRGEALALMRRRHLRHLPVVDPAGRLADLLLLEDLLAPVAVPNHALVLAGGDGTRLRPLTESVPKPLLRVGGKPLLEILVERLRDAGVRTVHLAVHHKSAMIEDHFGDGGRLGLEIRYVREPEPLGTAGALALAEGLGPAPFLMINGDILTRCDFRGMLAFHDRQGAEITVGTVPHDVELQYGVVEVADDRLLRVAEKPRLQFLINSGIYVVSPSAVALVQRGEHVDATDLVRRLIAAGRPVAAFPITDYWLDVGRHDDFRKADRDVAEGLLD